MKPVPTLFWFRNDMRLDDNPALAHAATHGPVVGVFIDDPTTPRPRGGASRWWLHQSLAALGTQVPLTLRHGESLAVLRELLRETGASRLVWSRRYDPAGAAKDKAIHDTLTREGFTVLGEVGNMLAEPWDISNAEGEPCKVFTPFWKRLQARGWAAPQPAPRVAWAAHGPSVPLDTFCPLPTAPNWAAGWETLWTPGEHGARQRAEDFMAHGLRGYADLRNRPDLPHVSRLSAAIHFGEVSVRRLAHLAQAAAHADPTLRRDADVFLSELGWREFSYHLLWNYPTLPHANWKPAFDAYPWRDPATDPAAARDLTLWQRGQTGYPFVDAGMRELWHTGWMHNRVRMVVASFLIKHLRLHWRHGEAWFWDTLVDADPASNAASWQWVAGSGADAAPYFRIFNPIGQGKKFDPMGAYTRHWCPELAKLPLDFLQCPWDATPFDLATAGVQLGTDYPLPCVNHEAARAAALAGYHATRADSA